MNKIPIRTSFQAKTAKNIHKLQRKFQTDLSELLAYHHKEKAQEVQKVCTKDESLLLSLPFSEFGRIKQTLGLIH